MITMPSTLVRMSSSIMPLCRAHDGKAGAKAGPHAGKKVTRTGNNTFISCILL